MRKQQVFLKWLVVAMIFHASTVKAQDLHFTQYFNAPLLINPANTGFVPDRDWRIGLNYRNQWSSIIDNPYKTMAAWGDVQLFNNSIDNGWVGLGGTLLKDVAGSGSLASTKGFASVAYHQLLGLSSLISAGFNIGFANKRIDIGKLTFGNQWNGKFFDATIPSGEAFAYNSITYFDLQAGLNYAFFPTENAYINAGFSAMHINRPKESFFNNKDIDTRIDPRFTAFVNGSFKLDDQWIINPNIYVSKMGNNVETVAGLNARYNLSGDDNLQLIGGMYARLGDAFSPLVGIEWNDLAVTISYDATISSLSGFNQSRGAYELSIVKSGLMSAAGKDVKCPSIRF